MRSLVALVLCSILSTSARAERTILEKGVGSVQLPPGYTNVEKPGGILRPEDATNAVFIKGGERIDLGTHDQGKLATYAENSFPEQKNIMSKWKSEINGHKVDVLVYKRKDVAVGGGAVVSYPDLKVDFACDYKNEGHLADFLFVAFSYRPSEAAPASERKQPK